MANPVRGEVQVKLDGTAYVMRPTWEALLAIERRIAPRTIVQLLMDVPERGLSGEESAVIVTEGIRAYARAKEDEMLSRVSEARIGELILESGGVQGVLAPCLEFLANVAGGSTKKKERAKKTTR